MVAQIHENLPRQPCITDIARRVGLSPGHARRLFVRTIGQSPKDFARDLRFRRAAELIRCTMLSIKEVSAHVGVKDLSHFSRDFKTRFGRSPTEYRRQSSNATDT